MLSLPDHFDKLLSNIEPKGERTKAAQKIPNQVRDFLQNHDGLKTVEPHSRLAGSYARHTATKDIKDVDVILILASEYKKQDPPDVLDALFSALHGLPEALEDMGKVVVRRHQRRSVNVHLEKQGFNLDIVPAVALKGIDEPLEIPDKDWSKWVSTHPLGYGDALSRLNADNKEKVVPLIKLLKHWRDVQMIYRRPKSYWLECMVYHAIADEVICTDGTSYAELFRDLLSSIYDNFLPHFEAKKKPEIKDPMLNHDVAHNWEQDDFEAFMNRVDESLGWANRALNSDDEIKAITLWQNIFGNEWFPKNVEDKQATRLRDAAVAGKIYVTSTGKVQIETPSERHVQPKPQRFYGES